MSTRLCLLSLVLLGACKKTVDSQDFTKFVGKRVAELGFTASAVKCPDQIEAKAGTKFACQVTLGTTAYDLDVTITSVANSKAEMDTAWRRGNAVLAAKLATAMTGELGEQLGTAVTLDCGPEPLRFLDDKMQTRCGLTSGAVTAEVQITFDKALTPTDWRLSPALISRKKLEANLTPAVRAKTSPDVVVTCGTTDLVPRPDNGELWCDVSNQKDKAKLKVLIDANLDLVSWEVARPN